MNTPDSSSSAATAANPNGLLFVASDVEPADDADFNRWYDQEHVEERVRIPGFLSGARYFSLEGGRKYLGLYRTESLAVFDSPGYRAAFEKQTPWSIANLDRMRQPVRRVCAVRAVTGFGSGSHVVVLPLPVAADAEEAQVASAARIGLQLKKEQAGFVQSYLLVPDTALSTPLPRESTEGRVLQPMLVIETSSADAARTTRATAAAAFDADPATGWLLALGWKLSAAELG
ncbi:hypothetical protein ACSFBF_21015 [Variovorax sp. ZT5P49]|uniref:hypothetical protein n=1 Tax=Variovorax sp. ZT5P49 TaxID=3443733 RepID=UPI003F4542DA